MKKHLTLSLGFLSLVLLMGCNKSVTSQEDVYSPKQGVICDQYVCADDKGISQPLTKQFLGSTAATKLASQGAFNVTEFTLMNGIFCDTKERLCREDRYFDAKGKRSAVSEKYTKMLFGV